MHKPTVNEILKLIDQNIKNEKGHAKKFPISSLPFKLFQSTAWAFEGLKEDILELQESTNE